MAKLSCKSGELFYYRNMAKILKTSSGSFPAVRMRRNRHSEWSRRMVCETTIDTNNLIWPVFVEEGKNIKTAVNSMPGVNRYSIDLLLKQVEKAKKVGIPATMLFPVVKQKLKTEKAEEAYNPDNLICRAIKAIKENIPDIGVICDVALDPYTSHGHDGLVKDDYVVNDETVEVLCKQAIVQAKAGCDIVAPSDMMDGRVAAIRSALDDEGFINVKIMSYAVKYASSFYGPFREAIGSADNLKGDKKTYQMDPANSDEAIREVALDIEEGADLVIVKPGMPYLDVIKGVSEKFNVPVFAYQVSGEYAMLKAAHQNSWLHWKKTMYESLVSFRRAGATGIITYAAIEMAEFIKKEKS